MLCVHEVLYMYNVFIHTWASELLSCWIIHEWPCKGPSFLYGSVIVWVPTVLIVLAKYEIPKCVVKFFVLLKCHD